MKAAYAELSPVLEAVQQSIDEWDFMIIGPDTVAVTLYVHGDIKAKGCPQHEIEWAWSGIVQHRGKSWKLVHTHESWVDAGEAMVALGLKPEK